MRSGTEKQKLLKFLFNFILIRGFYAIILLREKFKIRTGVCTTRDMTVSDVDVKRKRPTLDCNNKSPFMTHDDECEVYVLQEKLSSEKQHSRA